MKGLEMSVIRKKENYTVVCTYERINTANRHSG